MEHHREESRPLETSLKKPMIQPCKLLYGQMVEHKLLTSLTSLPTLHNLRLQITGCQGLRVVLATACKSALPRRIPGRPIQNENLQSFLLCESATCREFMILGLRPISKLLTFRVLNVSISINLVDVHFSNNYMYSRKIR